MKYHLIILVFLSFLSGCAGINPNPGERSVDTAWNSNKANQAYKQAIVKAKAGEPWAQLRVGIFYENGWGVEKDLTQAEFWYEKVSNQESSGNWAEGVTVGLPGKPGFFNQNSDARIAQYNLAQLYFNSNKKLDDALILIKGVIEKSKGMPIFFCCEFLGGRSFFPNQFEELKTKIENKLAEN